MRIHVLILVLVLCFLASCDDPRPALAPGTVMSIADMKLELEGRDWGNPREVISPNEVAQDGRLFWTVHYGLGPDDEQRIVYVNADTHWAHVRSARDPEKVTTALVQAKPAAVLKGSQFPAGPFILVLEQLPLLAAHDEAKRLNAVASETGLIPQFSARRIGDDLAQLIYGWNDEHGILQNDDIQNWVSLRTNYQKSFWLNLLGE